MERHKFEINEPKKFEIQEEPEKKFEITEPEKKKFLIEKRLFNIKMVFESGLADYIVKEHFNPVIVLFGSYSRGEDTEKSDIDIAIFGREKRAIFLCGVA